MFPVDYNGSSSFLRAGFIHSNIIYFLGNPALQRLLKVTPLFTRTVRNIKVELLNLESQIQAENIPVSLPSSPIKI